MAHNVNTAFQVHQSLHGYAQGHQQLAMSAQLKPRDTRAMLVMSDISGPGVRPADNGYLTGYPLPDSKYYVLARTWAAPEMPRPGCVWTHSLLLDFADLATLSDPGILLKLFHRPEAGEFRKYDRLISIAGGPGAALPTSSEDYARRILAALYERPRSKIVGARAQEVDSDKVVVALWSQQWPRLRRTFRFCTQTGMDRSGELGQFDLQLYAISERASRGRFAEAVDFGEFQNPGEDWVEDALADLKMPNAARLRTFMHNIGGDIDSGREAFKPLCRLHVQLERFQTDPLSVGGAVEVLEQDFGPVHAKTARALVTSEAVKLPVLNDTAFDFVVRNLDLIERSTLVDHGQALGRQIWARSPERLRQMLAGSDQEQEVAKATLSHLTSEDYLAALDKAPDMATFVLAQEPELVGDARFWGLRSVPAADAFSAATKNPILVGRVLTALIENNRDDLVTTAMRSFGPVSILRALADRWQSGKSSDHTSLDVLLKAASRDPNAIAEFLSAGAVPRDMLQPLALQLAPDTVPNDYGADPWFTALGDRRGKKSSFSHLYLHAFGLTRALGYRSRSQAELAVWSFEPIYHALARNRFPDDAWRLLDTRLPWLMPWQRWDRCLQVRDAVVDLFIDRNLSAAHFARLSDDNELFEGLLESAARSYRGRKFLTYVRYELDQAGAQSRVRLLDRAAGTDRSYE
jgi:hypothetical protein